MGFSLIILLMNGYSIYSPAFNPKQKVHSMWLCYNVQERKEQQWKFDGGGT